MRDFVCLHAQLAVSDGFTHQPIYPLSPATADTAVAGQETCAHRAAHLPPGRRSDMSPTSPTVSRGHRVASSSAHVRCATTGHQFGY
jgi:hypothetical protein